jgi:hypothetical protein
MSRQNHHQRADQKTRDKLHHVVNKALAHKELTEAANKLRAAHLDDLKSINITAAECRALGYMLLAAASLIEGEWMEDPIAVDAIRP